MTDVFVHDKEEISESTHIGYEDWYTSRQIPSQFTPDVAALGIPMCQDRDGEFLTSSGTSVNTWDSVMEAQIGTAACLKEAMCEIFTVTIDVVKLVTGEGEIKGRIRFEVRPWSVAASLVSKSSGSTREKKNNATVKGNMLMYLNS